MAGEFGVTAEFAESWKRKALVKIEAVLNAQLPKKNVGEF